MSRSLLICALTGMCASVFVLSMNASTLANALAGLTFGLGFAAITTELFAEMERNK